MLGIILLVQGGGAELLLLSEPVLTTRFADDLGGSGVCRTLLYGGVISSYVGVVGERKTILVGPAIINKTKDEISSGLTWLCLAF